MTIVEPEACRQRERSLVRLALRASVGLLALLIGLSLIAAYAGGRVLDQGEIAFESDRSGAWNLYLIDVATTRTVPLTRGTNDSRWPAWSPDGQQIAYNTGPRSLSFGEIFIRNVAGGAPRQLTASDGNHWHPAWSPDGRQIVFMFNFQLMRLINVDGSGERMIGTGFSPAWSPDGKTIIYYDDPGQRFSTDIYTVALDSAHMNNLTAHLSNDWSPVWSPDGQWIAFVSSREDRLSADLYLLDAACTRVPNVTQACVQSIKRLTFDRGNISAPAWSPDSRHLAYVVNNLDSSSLYLIDLDGQNKRRLTFDRAHDESPAWRPAKAS